jgi:autotransporter-associated beta strand protein
MKKSRIEKAMTSTLVAALVLVGGLMQAAAANVNWTGSGTSLFWSDANNWNPIISPGPGDGVSFLNTGSTNGAGVVNNVISSDTTISNLTYLATVSLVSSVTNYHTTLINPGVTLNIQRGTNLLFVGDIADASNLDPQFYYTITGAGGSLVAGDTNAPNATQGLRVTAVQRSIQNHIASLDLSGLDNFTLAGGYFWVGINTINDVQHDRPDGHVYLAKTNLIIMTGTNFDAQGLGSFRIGETAGNTPTKPSIVELGQQNSIYTPYLKVGGTRVGAPTGTTPAGGFMFFHAGLTNPILKLRGTDGVSRLGTMRIGDNSSSTSGSSPPSFGNVDLSGGTVDGFVDEMYVGRGPGGNDTQTPGRVDGANGTLTWTAGTFDIRTLLIGYQFGNNLSTNTGTVNVVSPNAKLIADTVELGRDAGPNDGGGVGILNINGGTVEIGTSLAESPGSGGNASSTIILTNNGVLNLQPAGDTNGPAVATFDTLEYSSGIVTNGTLALTNINVDAPATEFVVNPGTVLNPGTVGTVATLTVNGGLTLNGGALAMDLGGTPDNISVSGDLNLSGTNSVSINVIGAVGPATYPIITYGGSLSGGLTNLQLTGTGIFADTRYTVGLDATAPNINLTVSGSAANLTWSGGNNGNAWDLKNTANWNSGSQQFFQFDQVTFDDTGDASLPVQLSGTLIPLGVTFAASSKHYTLAGSGKITGTVGVNVSGGAKVTLLTTNNDYTGGTTINAGILEIGDGTTADGALAGNVTNNAELDFNPAFSNNVTALIIGAGSMVKTGPGVTRLSGANNAFTGPVTVNQGTLQAGTATAAGTGAGQSGIFVTVNSGATFDTGGNLITNSLELNGAGVGGGGALISSGSAGNFTRDIQLLSDTTLGGKAGITVQPAAVTTLEPGLTAFQHKITKVGTNTFFVNGLNHSIIWNPDFGSVDVQQGLFLLGGFLNLGSDISDPITVFTNAILGFETVNTNNDPLIKTFVFNDGSCAYAAVNPSLSGPSAIDGSATLSGTVVFDINSNQILSVNCPVTGGTLVKGIGNHPGFTSTGSGTLVLANAANTLSGFKVQTGTVALTNSATVGAPQLQLAGGTLSVAGRTDGTLTLASGQSLVGNGTVTGIVSSPVGSSVIPSATNGIITVSSNLTLRGTTILDLNRLASGMVTNSQIIVKTNATLDCGGSLVLTSSGQPLQAGDTFKLFKAATILNPFTDASITYPTLGAGLSWTNQIAIDGSVAVVGTGPTTPPTLGVTVSGGSALSITWPTGYTSYVLQIQSNGPGMGLNNTNWTTVNTTTNQFNLPIDPASGSVFLRLLKP